VLLGGTREGTEEERLRRQRNYRRNRPEAIRRRQKVKETFETIGMGVAIFLGLALVLAIFLGGGAVLGRFVLPRLFGHEAIIPLTVGGGILGGLLLYLVVPFFDPTLPGWLTGKPGWLEAIDQEVKQKKRTYQLNFRSLIVLAYFFSALLLGSIGWQMGRNNIEITATIGLLGGLAAAYLAKRILGSALEFWNLVVIFVLTAYGMAKGLTLLFDALGWRAQISNPNISALGGILAALPLAYFLAKRLAGPPPPATARIDAILEAIIENPARISDLDSFDRDWVLSWIKLAETVPEVWTLLPPKLQKLIPPPESSVARDDTGKQKKPGKRGQSDTARPRPKKQEKT